MKVNIQYSIELDEIITDVINFVKKSIKDIFHSEGEAEFRKIEEKTIINLQNETKIVLSLGGGAILSAQTRKLLKILW